MLLENQPYPQDPRVRAEAESLAAAGHRVTVYAPRRRGQSRREQIAGVEVRRYRLPSMGRGIPSLLLEYAIAHVQLIACAAGALRRGADVLHIHNPPDTLFPAAMLARSSGRAVVFDHHDLFPELVELRTGSVFYVLIARAAQWLAVRTATTVIVTNESQRDIVLRRTRIAPERVVIVRNGPARAMLAANGARRPGVLAEPAIVFVGELSHQDGVLALPDLLRQPALAGARLTVVGDGYCRAELAEQIAADPALSARVTLAGRVDHALVPALLAQADLALDPAPNTPLNSASTMIKIAEYMAAGLPVVAFDLSETRRTAGEGALYARCGDVAEMAELLAALAADPSMRERVSELGRNRVQELLWEQSERSLLDVYDRLPVRVVKTAPLP